MAIKQSLKQLIAVVLLGWMVWVPVAQSAMVSSQSVLPQTPDVFTDPQVLAQLSGMGVDTVELQARLAALSPQEQQALAERLDEMPAGQGVLNTLFLVFLVFVITDIIGATDVFPFVNKI